MEDQSEANSWPLPLKSRSPVAGGQLTWIIVQTGCNVEFAFLVAIRWKFILRVQSESLPLYRDGGRGGPNIRRWRLGHRVPKVKTHDGGIRDCRVPYA